MKHLFLLSFLMAVCHLGPAQVAAPASTAELASSIGHTYRKPVDKIRAAYHWVTMNIRYDATGVFAMNNSPDPRDIIDKAFEKRSGVCGNFAAIFTDLCRQMGFNAEVVEGYTRSGNRGGHSWSAVYVEDDWYLFDPTWDAGKHGNFSYFMVSGEYLSASHRPFDPIWQLNALHRDAEDLPKYSDYQDAIAAYQSADTISRLESMIHRISNTRRPNELTRTYLKVLRSQLEGARQEDQMVWYELAVGRLNEATGMLNDLIGMRNAGIIDENRYGEMKRLVAGIDQNIIESYSHLQKVDNSKAVLVYGTDAAREQLARLKKRSHEQAQFLESLMTSRSIR